MIKIPSLRDIRWVLLLSLLFYAIVLIRNPGFGKSPLHILIIFSVVTISDILINYLANKRWHFPLSGMTSSIGIILLIFSPHWYIFIVIALLVSLSKYFIKMDKLHVYNPNNFAMVAAFVFLSSNVTTTAGRWNFDETMFFMIVAFGLVISFIGKRLVVSLTFISSFAFIAVLRALLLNQSFDYVFLPYHSPTFYLFTFYHITDPVTTPSNLKGKIIFGISLAFIDNVLRSYNILYSPFYAYFILASFQPFLKDIFVRPYDRKLQMI